MAPRLKTDIMFQEQHCAHQHQDHAPDHLRDHRDQQTGSDDIADAEIHTDPAHQITF